MDDLLHEESLTLDCNKLKRFSFLLIDHLDQMSQQIYQSVDPHNNTDIKEQDHKLLLARLHRNVNDLLLQCAMILHPKLNQEQGGYLLNGRSCEKTSVPDQEDLLKLLRSTVQKCLGTASAFSSSASTSTTDVQQAQPHSFNLHLTLEELHQGCHKSIVMERTVSCDQCTTSSTALLKSNECTQCNAHGFIERSQQRILCSGCEGLGTTTSSPGKAVASCCKECRNTGILRKRYSLTVQIPAHSRHNDRLSYTDLVSVQPGLPTTQESLPLVLNLFSLTHSHFRPWSDIQTRQEVQTYMEFYNNNKMDTLTDADLLFLKKITMMQAIHGFEFTFQDLDNHTHTIQSVPGHIYVPGEIWRLRNQGFASSVGERGCIYFLFQIQFEQLDTIHAENIKNILHSANQTNTTSVGLELCI